MLSQCGQVMSEFRVLQISSAVSNILLTRWMWVLLYTVCCVIKASLNRAAYVSCQLGTGKISKTEWRLVTRSWQDSSSSLQISKGNRASWIILVHRITDGIKNNSKLQQKRKIIFVKFSNVCVHICLTFSIYHDAHLSLMKGSLGLYWALPQPTGKLANIYI